MATYGYQGEDYGYQRTGFAYQGAYGIYAYQDVPAAYQATDAFVYQVRPTIAPSGPPPAGTVPVRYIVGETANVVPVVTVLAWDFGVVRCREFVGPANVVPIREVTTEYPHTKILIV